MDAEFDNRLSEFFIAIIPKVKGPSSLNEFCPISLLGWIHKLVARVLTSRLRSIIDQLISHTQTTFIRGHSIYDGWIIASEVLNIMKWNKESLVFKFDFEKDYDRVSWSFLSFILRKTIPSLIQLGC